MNDDAVDLQDQDESVRIAVKALDDMRNNAQRAEAASTSSSDSNSPFVTRVSHLPLVNTALRAYEQGKASSRVVKYGAEMVESSVKTISKPVIDRLPVNVNQLDEFACRQLDRLDRYRRPSTTAEPNATSPPTSPGPSQPRTGTSSQETSKIDEQSGSQLKSEETDDHKIIHGKKGKSRSWIHASSPFVGPAPPPPDLTPSSSSQSQTQDRQVIPRSRWQAVLSEAGGFSAALSDESLRRLKYCLEWLQYATAHIDAQILILRDFTASLQPLPSQTREPHPPISQAHMRTLVAVRRDIVHTVKQVVDVVSRYAGGALPEPARTRVRGFILGLPQRWAQRAGAPGHPASTRDDEAEREREEREREASGSGAGPVRRSNRRGRERGPATASAPSSRATSPMARHPRHSEENGEPVSAPAAITAAQRILTLATESLDMMRGVTGVVKDSLDRADAWVGRFRTVGIQRGERTEDTASATSDENREMELDLSSLRHRRVHSFGSQFDESDAMPSPYSGASSYSSYAGGSSVPSTPGLGTQTPTYIYSKGAASPNVMGLGLSSMSLLDAAHLHGTPRSVVGALPDDVSVDPEGVLIKQVRRDGHGLGEEVEDQVKIVGKDVGGEREDGGLEEIEEDVPPVAGKMDVDL